MEDFTPRNVAKHVLSAAISMKVGKVTKEALSDYTRFEDDDIVVKITSGVAGWYAGHKAKPYTDKVVDKTADWYNARKAKKNQDADEK